ncbi:MAG: tRNA 2-thiocytidine biosynthesis protein TtcA [Clostridia bacterium]|nr:tRNA 2-thiocytidine biosynthesis protein TtcA [Clostridia bacterium]
MERYKEIEETITKSYRKVIWKRFVKAITEFDMIQEGDKIAVCMSGGKDSFLMAKCFQEIKKHRNREFELVFLVMNPGYSEKNIAQIKSNAKLLNIPITIFETDIFERVDRIEDNPCYLCARMRRGYLYEKAKELGCNKIALGHHFDDVIETVLMGMLYGAQFQTMMPKINSTNHPGMELIRPLYYVKEEDVIRWRDYNGLEFLKCACKITERMEVTSIGSKRDEIKKLIKDLKKVYDNIDINIFRSTQEVNLDTIISYKKGNEIHNFLDDYENRRNKIIEESEKKC